MRREIEIVRLQQIQEQLRQIRHLNRQQMQLLRNFHHDVMAHLRRWRVLFGLLGALLAFVIYIGLRLVLTQLTPDQSMVHIILGYAMVIIFGFFMGVALASSALHDWLYQRVSDHLLCDDPVILPQLWQNLAMVEQLATALRQDDFLPADVRESESAIALVISYFERNLAYSLPEALYTLAGNLRVVLHPDLRNEVAQHRRFVRRLQLDLSDEQQTINELYTYLTTAHHLNRI
ncbi:hypothetical protein [Weissella cibaria]|uniref:hypothetical protein n=1 Tax=Weissella cibaria TaxID=137591 RepID=UPI00223AE9A7|nr:hypothetical protein [Weissella cibaria]MCT0020378.1 hypothetical protein [Weissella cibaria]